VDNFQSYLIKLCAECADFSATALRTEHITLYVLGAWYSRFSKRQTLKRSGLSVGEAGATGKRPTLTSI